MDTIAKLALAAAITFTPSLSYSGGGPGHGVVIYNDIPRLGPVQLPKNQESPVVAVSRDVAELERRHMALANARSFKETLDLSKDFAKIFANYLKRSTYTQLAVESEYFRRKLGYESLAGWRLAGDIGVGIYVDFIIKKPLAENLSEYIESRQAQAIANMLGAGIEATVTGGITLPFYIFDQAVLVQEAALETKGAFIDAQAATFNLLESTVNIRNIGVLSTREALESVERSRLTIDTVPWSSVDQAKMKILHDLVEVKLRKSSAGESLLQEGEIISYARSISQASQFDLVDYANEIAKELDIPNWPEPKATVACVKGCSELELYQ